MSNAKFEAHIRTTAWYKVLFEAAKDDDTAASEYRMARMAAQEAWSAAGRVAAEQIEALTTELARARAAIDVYHARVVEMERNALPTGFFIDAYAFEGDPSDVPIKILRARQVDGPDRWKVMRGSKCRTKRGAWIWEPLPSSRTDAFLKRTRFDTAKEAIDAAVAAKERG